MSSSWAEAAEVARPPFAPGRRADLPGGPRLIVHESVRDELVAKVVERAEAIMQGAGPTVVAPNMRFGGFGLSGDREQRIVGVGRAHQRHADPFQLG